MGLRAFMGGNAMGLGCAWGVMGLGAVHGVGDGPGGCTGGGQWAWGLPGAGREEGLAGWY